MLLSEQVSRAPGEIAEIRQKIEAMPGYSPLALGPGSPDWPKNIEVHSLVPDLLIVRHEVFKDDRGETEVPIILSQIERILGCGLKIVQNTRSRNRLAGTGRGAHTAPYYKITECTSGRVQTIVLDMRRDSPSFLKVATVILESSQGQASGVSLVIPPTCAHAYLTLLPDSAYQYMQTGEWTKDVEVGFNLLDPYILPHLADEPLVLSNKDKRNDFVSKVFYDDIGHRSV